MIPNTAVFANGVAYIDVELSNAINTTTVVPLNIVINASSACLKRSPDLFTACADGRYITSKRCSATRTSRRPRRT